jgi:cytochrome c-type biogenesis protein CcmH/NrfG
MRVDPAAAMAEAEAAYAARDWSGAEANYLAAARASPRDPEPWFRLGNVYFRRGSHDLAARAYEETLRVSPDHPKAWHNLGVVRLHQADASFARVPASGGSRDPQLEESAKALRAIVGEAIAPGDQAAP